MDVSVAAAGAACKGELSLENWVAMVCTLEGRDKVTKIIQYGSRALMWYYSAKRSDESTAAMWRTAYKTTQLSRKAFRMAKALDELNKLTDVLDNKAVAEPVRTMKIIRHMFMGGFWFFDNLYYLATVKLLRMQPEPANHWATRFWFVANHFAILIAYIQLAEHQAKRQKLTAALREIDQKLLELRETESKSTAPIQSDDSRDTVIQLGDERFRLVVQLDSANEKQFKLCLALVKAICDYLVSCNTPGVRLPELLFGSKINDGVVGLLGVISALIVIYGQWPDRTAHV